MSTVSETEGSTKPEETETEGSTKPEEKEIPRSVNRNVEAFVKANINFEIEKLKKNFNKRLKQQKKTIDKLDKRLKQSEETINKLGEFAIQIVKEKKSPDAQTNLENILAKLDLQLEALAEKEKLMQKSESLMESESLINRRKEGEFLF